MQLNRAEQRQLLQELAESFPNPCAPKLPNDPDAKRGKANFKYLEEHGLVRHVVSTFGRGGAGFDHGHAITAAGLDFLADDGGLSAILGVVTIKLHDDTIKNLIAMRIQAAELPPADKKRYLDQLRALPAESTKHLVLKLVDMGLETAPQAMERIGKILAGL
jgi:hypothetical protein